MKVFILLLSVFCLLNCSQKYQTYHVVDKYNYKIDDYDAPISPKLLPREKVKRTICSDQIFFSRNAEKESKKSIERIVKTLCPQGRFISNAKLTEDWWTTIAYSRSCMTFEGYCASPR